MNKLLIANCVLMAVGCTTSEHEKVDQALDSMERHMCYSRAGENAAKALGEICPTTDGADVTKKAKELVLCEAVPTVLENLNKALKACDGE